jgi:hypothetical protein
MSDQLVNRVAASGLITLKPEEWVPTVETVALDLKDHLFMGMILKEKDFREQMAAYDWKSLTAKVLCIHCSADAIIPSWAYMLVAANAAPHAAEVFFGTPEAWPTARMLLHVEAMDIEPYRDQRVVLKGCSDKVTVGPEVYLALTSRLVPVVKSLMFGEPCSTVPVYKRSRPGA